MGGPIIAFSYPKGLKSFPSFSFNFEKNMSINVKLSLFFNWDVFRFNLLFCSPVSVLSFCFNFFTVMFFSSRPLATMVLWAIALSSFRWVLLSCLLLSLSVAFRVFMSLSLLDNFSFNCLSSPSKSPTLTFWVLSNSALVRLSDLTVLSSSLTLTYVSSHRTFCMKENLNKIRINKLMIPWQ